MTLHVIERHTFDHAQNREPTSIARSSVAPCDLWIVTIHARTRRFGNFKTTNIFTWPNMFFEYPATSH